MTDHGSSQPAKGQILFVDDDAFYREMAHEALTEAGYTVTLAENGTAALDLIQYETFDLLVLDLSMPGLSGFDVIERLHGSDGRPTVPTLVITGHEDTQSVERAFLVGASSFLVKPVNWVLFVHHVNFVLKAIRSEAELKTASRMAEFMNSLKTRLISTIANDAQAPLKSAFGFATLIAQEADGPINSALYATWIDEIHRALEKVVATHTKMLDFGRALSDAIELSEQPFNLSKIVIDLAAQSAVLGTRRMIKIDVSKLPTTPLAFNGDPALITQALRVPLENAARLSPRGSNIVVSMNDKPNGDLEICIVDASGRVVGSLQSPARAGEYNAARNIEHSSSMRLMRSIIEAHGGHFDSHCDDNEILTSRITLPAHRRVSPEGTDHRLGGPRRDRSAGAPISADPSARSVLPLHAPHALTGAQMSPPPKFLS